MCHGGAARFTQLESALRVSGARVGALAHERKRELELGAFALLARDLDLAAVRIDDAFGDREAEAGAAFFRAAVPVAIEDVGEGALFDAGALVAHGDDRVLAVALELDVDRSAARVLEGVADQVA